MKTGLLHFGILLGMMAISAVAGNPKTDSQLVKPARKVAAKPAATLKNTAIKETPVKVSTRPRPVDVRPVIAAVEQPASRKPAHVAKPAAAKKLTPPVVKVPPLPRVASPAKTVAVCPAKKPPPGPAAAPIAALVLVIRRDPGEFIDISYPPPRAKRQAIAAAKLPRR